MTLFKGVATALVTPFENGKVDMAALERLLDAQLNAGVDAIVVLGTTGEPATLTSYEKEEIVKVAVSKLKGKLPVIVGSGTNGTAKAVEDCKVAERLGADGLLVVTPYYNKCTQEGLIAHYSAIAESVDLPVICYNVPSRTGVNMLPETFAKLSERKNIAAIKEASGNMEQIERAISLSHAAVYSGDDALAVPTIAMGGMGVISVASNVYPEYFAKMARLALSGDFKTASKMQLHALGLIKALFCEVNPIPVKRALEIKGLCSAQPRLPLTRMSAPASKALEREMRLFGSSL